MNMDHGGDIHAFARRYGRPPLDFSASLNPYGLPSGVRRAARAAVGASHAYPDPQCGELRAALSRHTGIPASHVLPGNGAADLIHRLVQARRPRRALLPVPTFLEYERALRAAGCEIGLHRLRPEDDFRLGDGILDDIRPGLDMFFLCQPNNPTGRLCEPALLAAIAARCQDSGTLLVADESFLPFVDQPGRHSLVPRMVSDSHLIVLVSMTKLYGMAGIRIGYGMSSDDTLLAAMADAGPPWPVSTVAQAAGVAALGEREFVATSLRAIAREKRRLAEGLAAHGCRVLGGEANFLFFHSARLRLDLELAEEGIAIRSCAGFTGLGPGYYRVAVRRRGENARLLRAIAKVTEG